MTRRATPAGLLGTLLLLVACAAAPRDDKRDFVHVTGQLDGDEVGIVVDADGVDDRRRWTTSGKACVGRLEPSSESNDLICFGRQRPMILRSDPGWTTLGDRVDVEFDPEIGLDITIWIVAKPYETHLKRAIRAVCKTVRIWKRERMGITFAKVDFIDATSHDHAGDFVDFEISDHEAVAETVADGGLGKRIEKQINVYYVERVEDEVTGDLETNGGHASKGGDSIAIGKTAGSDLLVHEIGHCFALTHPEDSSFLTCFDKENVMWASSSVRDYLTEGQIYRAQASPDSALNMLYEMRVGETLPLSKWVLPRPLPIWFRMWNDGDLDRDTAPGSP